jgi:hypothetical protein
MVLLSGKPREFGVLEQPVNHRDIALSGALVLAGFSGSVALLGAVRWYRGEASRVFWLGVRAGQVIAGAYALLAGVLYLSNDPPSSNLFYLYALLPVVIGFVAEQLRVISADHVLGSRDLDSAAEVGELPIPQQHEIVIAIVRREMGVMALAALVVCFLALRAWGTY